MMVPDIRFLTRRWKIFDLFFIEKVSQLKLKDNKQNVIIFYLSKLSSIEANSV